MKYSDYEIEAKLNPIHEQHHHPKLQNEMSFKYSVEPFGIFLTTGQKAHLCTLMYIIYTCIVNKYNRYYQKMILTSHSPSEAVEVEYRTDSQ